MTHTFYRLSRWTTRTPSAATTQVWRHLSHQCSVHLKPPAPVPPTDRPRPHPDPGMTSPSECPLFGEGPPTLTEFRPSDNTPTEVGFVEEEKGREPGDGRGTPTETEKGGVGESSRLRGLDLLPVYL